MNPINDESIADCTLQHPDGIVRINHKGEKKQLQVSLTNNNLYMPVGSFETSYPRNLIERILALKGPAYLCDEIMRDEHPDYTERSLHFSVLGYVDAKDFEGKSILDFGCGAAASTMVLARMLPGSTITGVELEPHLLEIAAMRSKHHGISDRTRFIASPNGEELPVGIGEFDYVFLNAVYEHLLPAERRVVLSLLWNKLKAGGVLFLNQTPNRWFPVEFHTTSGLPLINYLPDRLAERYAQRLSKRHLANDDWSTLLRQGIRGGSVGEIKSLLVEDERFSPEMLEPSKLGLRDRVDIWYEVSGKERYIILKKSFRMISKWVYKLSGIAFLPSLSLAIRKSRKA